MCELQPAGLPFRYSASAIVVPAISSPPVLQPQSQIKGQLNQRLASRGRDSHARIASHNTATVRGVPPAKVQRTVDLPTAPPAKVQRTVDLRTAPPAKAQKTVDLPTAPPAKVQGMVDLPTAPPAKVGGTVDLPTASPANPQKATSQPTSQDAGEEAATGGIQQPTGGILQTEAGAGGICATERSASVIAFSHDVTTAAPAEAAGEPGDNDVMVGV